MYKMKLIGLGLTTVLALSFNGCGSDSSDGDSGGSSGDSGSSSQLVSYSCEGSMSNMGMTVTSKMGANGNLTCEELSFNGNSFTSLAFKSGTNEMIIDQIIATSEASSSEGTGTTKINLKDGTETLKGTDPDHGSVDCVNTYDVPSPLYIYDATDLENFYLDDYQLISTTCPDWVNDDDDFDDDEFVQGTFTQNATITETSGAVSEISTYMSIK